MTKFDVEVQNRIYANSVDEKLHEDSQRFLQTSIDKKYSYNFSWLGRPIIQYPQDMIAIQEIIWQVQPDLIIETGIAHGGSLIFSASLLELNAACNGPVDAKVLGIDIEIRDHNREAIEKHPLFSRITMIEGDSTSPDIISQVSEIVRNKKSILVCLDSNHTHSHVLAELKAYAPLVSVGSYCVVFDTIIEDMPEDFFPDRPWGKGNNPKTAVWEYLNTHTEFEIDANIENKLLITVAHNGYLKRIG